MKKLSLIALISILTSCGGGGGSSSDTNYSGDVTLDIERDDLDSGDLTRLNLDVDNLNPDGAILKIRSSKSLRYVKNTAIQFPDRDEETRISPAEDVSASDARYLVFFLYPHHAINGRFISLQFKMKAVKGDKDAFIQVDLDNNDPSVSDSSEFKASDPRFSPLIERGLYIAPDANEPTPTPVASGTVTATPTPKK
jgi:hypothetical protein